MTDKKDYILTAKEFKEKIGIPKEEEIYHLHGTISGNTIIITTEK